MGAGDHRGGEGDRHPRRQDGDHCFHRAGAEPPDGLQSRAAEDGVDRDRDSDDLDPRTGGEISACRRN